MSFRRTWDKDQYAQKAKDRQEFGDDYVDGQKEVAQSKKTTKEEFKSAEEGAAGPIGSERAFLKQRDHKLELDEKVGKIEIFNPNEDASKAGFYCEVCKCLLKDSASYLDHINGKRHQSALGYSMRVERAGVDDVKERLASLKRKASGTGNVVRAPAYDEYKQKLEKMDADKDANKKRKKEQEEELKKQKKFSIFEEELETEEKDEMAMMMGFGGFGSSKKK